MSKVTAAITTSVDGYVVGPNDGPGNGLGDGGERLHHWVFGGPWTYDDPPTGEATGEDAEWLKQAMSGLGAVVGGRNTYEAADRWGDKNPFGVPIFIVTHRPEEEPDTGEFNFVGDLARGFLLAGVTPGIEGEVVNLGCGEEVSVRDVTTTIHSAACPITKNPRR